jgi:hypothetical protein
LCPQLHAADEAAFIEVWKLHTANPDDHTAIIAACQNYAKANQLDELRRVVEGIEAWHLLKTGNQDKATAILESHLERSTQGITAGAASLAKAWLSRLDILPLKKALQCYYRKEVGYPESLDALSAHPGVPSDLEYRIKDRWDRSWNYKLVGFKSMPGFRDQRYDVSCMRIPTTSDIESALQLPYAGNIRARPTRSRASGAGTSVVEFGTWVDGKESGTRFQLGVNRTSGDLRLAYVGERLLIVHDRNHWKALPKP